MMVCDAKWFAKILPNFSNEELSPILNIGSSTKKFRTQDQPHIQEYVFGPLEERGVEVVHCDLKKAEGVDIQCNIFDKHSIEILASHEPKAIICTHMFEHVEDRDELARRLMDILPEGGLFFITVPNSYHHHADPIDTMYRPSPEELADLFKKQKILIKELLTDGNYWGKIRKRPLTLFFRHFFRFFIPFVSWEKWKRSMRKLYWLFNSYKVSAIAGQKVG